MPTPLLIFADADVSARYQAPFLSQVINNKTAALLPDGTYRGFKLSTNASALTVTVLADPVFQDHQAALLSPTGEFLTARRTGGAFNLDLSALIDKTVILCLVAAYTLGKVTSVTLQAFQLSPVDEFTGAGDNVVPIGTVVVPHSGVIPLGNITHRFRREAWQRRSLGDQMWSPVLQNGGFERAIFGASTLTESRIAQGWFASASDLFTLSITAGVHTGAQGVALTAPAAAVMVSGLLRQYVNVPVDAVGGGQRPAVRLEFFLRQMKLVASGTLQMSLEFVDTNSASIFVLSAVVPLSAVGVDGAMRQFTDTVGVPTGAVLLRKVDLVFTNISVGSAGEVLRLDDVQAWVEPNRSDKVPSFADPWAREYDASVVRLSDPSASMGQDAAVLSFDSTTPANEGVVNLDPVRDVLQSATAAPALSPGGRIFDVGRKLLGSVANLIKPRFHAKYKSTNANNGNTYTLMQQFEPSAGIGAGNACMRMYADGFRNTIVFTNNAVWNSTTQLWSQDDGAVASGWMSLARGKFEVKTKAAQGAGTWNDAGWVSAVTADSVTLAVATNFAVLGTSAFTGNAVFTALAQALSLVATGDYGVSNPDPATNKPVAVRTTNTADDAITPVFLLHAGADGDDGVVLYGKRLSAEVVELRIGAFVDGVFGGPAIIINPVTGAATFGGSVFVNGASISMLNAASTAVTDPVVNNLTKRTLTKAVCCAVVDSGNPGVYAYDGANIVSVTDYDLGGGLYALRFTFAASMGNLMYAVTYGIAEVNLVHGIKMLDSTKNVAYFDIYAWNPATAAVVNMRSLSAQISVVVVGVQ